MQVDIENLFKQNVNDLSSIKELYRKLQDMENKILEIKYIDNQLANKLKKEYEKLKKIILDENIQIKLNNDIESINTKLSNDIGTINLQLDTITNDIGLEGNIFKNTVNESGAMVTFTDDDGRMEVWNRLYPLFKSKGVPFTPCVSVIKIGTEDHMTLEQIKQIQADGNEITSHYYNHDYPSEEASEQNLEKQFGESKQWFDNNGLNVETVIYVGGIFHQRLINTAKKYYRCGMSLLKDQLNTQPIRQFALRRHLIGKVNTLNDYKKLVDEAVEKKAWLIFHTHCWDTREFDQVQGYQDISDLIDYIKSLNIPIVNPKTALDSMENVVDIGDECFTGGHYFRVSKTGKTESDISKLEASKRISYKGITSDTPITAFEKEKISYISYMGGESEATSSTFPETRVGTYIVYRNRDKQEHLSFSEWYPHRKAYYYRRYWDKSNNTWLAWQSSTNQVMEVKTDNSILTTTPVSDLEDKKVSIITINGASSSQFPDGGGGKFIVDSSKKSNGHVREQFKSYNKIKTYERYCDAGGRFSKWFQYMFGDCYSVTVPAQSIPANSCIDVDIDLTGVGGSDMIVATPFGGQDTGIIYNVYAKTNKVSFRLYNTTTKIKTTGDKQYKVVVISFI